MPKYKHGSGSIYKRGKTWWLSYYVNGKQVWESAKTKDRAEARRILQAKIGQRAEDRLIVGADRITFEDLLHGVEDEYKANSARRLIRSSIGQSTLPRHLQAGGHSILR